MTTRNLVFQVQYDDRIRDRLTRFIVAQQWESFIVWLFARDLYVCLRPSEFDLGCVQVACERTLLRRSDTQHRPAVEIVDDILGET